jgi:hypothetical protein
VEKLRVIPPFEFENWAVIALGGMGVAASERSKLFSGFGKFLSSFPKRLKSSFEAERNFGSVNLRSSCQSCLSRHLTVRGGEKIRIISAFR